MNIKKIITIAAFSALPILSHPIEPQKEKNSSGTFLIEPEEMYFPEFPLVTFYNNKDTIHYQGNCVGIINYNLPAEKYFIKIEPGTDSLTKQKGEYFEPYQLQIKMTPGKNAFQVLSSKLENKVLNQKDIL